MIAHASGPRDRYIALIKDALTFSLWPQPPIPVSSLDPRLYTPAKRLALQAVRTTSRPLEAKGLQIVKSMEAGERELEDGLVWPNYGDTMIGRKRMDNLEYCVRTVIQDEVRGDLIETGVWRGGACIFMRAILAAYGVTDRKVFVADSFEGLPPPNPAYPADAGDPHHERTQLEIGLETVKENFRRYDLLDDQVVFLKGWFSETLPSALIEEIAVLRLDGDMYESTMDGLNNLYPKLSMGGFLIVDDYNLETCRAAVGDYRKAHEIDAEIIDIDGSGIYWRKAT